MTQAVTLLQGLAAWTQEFFKAADIFLHRRRIVQARRRQVQGASSFSDERLEVTESVLPMAPLAKPEIELLRRLRPELDALAMLHMGVGRGEAGVYFASAVKSYKAFDSRPSHVAAARARLDDYVTAQDIVVGEASRMDFAPDRAYGFIFFGAQGLDQAVPEARAQIFREVRRVGKEGAWFCFSSRNLQGLSVRNARGGVDLLKRWQRRLLMAAANENFNKLECQPSAMLFDASGGYELPSHYVTPKEQVRVLKESGFHDMRVFSGRTGLEVRDWRRWDKLADEVIYYLCRV